MAAAVKRADSLQVGDLEGAPVWRFVNDDSVGELAVSSVSELPAADLSGMLVGTQVRLANGDQVWALVGNVDVASARRTELFLALSVERAGRWFHLARYHDFDYAERGPQELASFLGLGVKEVFPISYDLRPFAEGDDEVLMGQVLEAPRERLTRGEIIALAVP